MGKEKIYCSVNPMIDKAIKRYSEMHGISTTRFIESVLLKWHAEFVALQRIYGNNGHYNPEFSHEPNNTLFVVLVEYFTEIFLDNKEQRESSIEEYNDSVECNKLSFDDTILQKLSYE